MADVLSCLVKPVGSSEVKKRVGRGIGSGLGKTAGRGQKGQFARSGGFKVHFEGGQTPLQRRLPKRGFSPLVRSKEKVAIVNLGVLEQFPAGMTVDEVLLKKKRFVKSNCDCIKILGSGNLSKKLTVVAHAFSASAAQKIREAGGEIVLRDKGTTPVQGG
ncbi:50S ribosomal protein L15 [Pajaroellobacter abortibovis]|uniref:Large ribosomal subunit protein uL15 n=1 Tax=Pajaroellobacter abortibovis TaxID=1882918 RepID=A0A1L6MY47_9BACT|nr:50S ribosomal protein L15 [Pajaroellobacter abortibovis]APS00416.1 50S ribosomal protein L15 [Pajaroellobacter abortibovis]